MIEELKKPEELYLQIVEPISKANKSNASKITNEGVILLACELIRYHNAALDSALDVKQKRKSLIFSGIEYVSKPALRKLKLDEDKIIEELIEKIKKLV